MTGTCAAAAASDERVVRADPGLLTTQRGAQRSQQLAGLELVPEVSFDAVRPEPPLRCAGRRGDEAVPRRDRMAVELAQRRDRSLPGARQAGHEVGAVGARAGG